MDKDIELVYDRATKRTFRYRTVAEQPQTFYFPQEWFANSPEGKPPEKLTIIVRIP